ncbi:MAG: hypothetical protein LH616_11420 [Ilumatobacteraceae bacterium]|nr:hypothetical protein [Ilumatobacteraceae bacterium]
MYTGFAISAVITVLVLGIVLTSLRKSGAFGMSKKKQQQAAQLAATGTKARAWILAIQPTGTVVNMINIQCDVAFRLEPIRGGQPFDVQKRMLLSQTAMPRIGDCWPSWFDPTDPSQFAVGQPTAMTPEAIATLREFGIPTPFDSPRP